MLNGYKFYPVQIEREGLPALLVLLEEGGFIKNGDKFVDSQERQVFLPSDESVFLKIGIPASDLITEQEQLDYILGLLGLGIDEEETV